MNEHLTQHQEELQMSLGVAWMVIGIVLFGLCLLIPALRRKEPAKPYRVTPCVNAEGKLVNL